MRVGFFTEVYHPVVNGIVSSLDALAGGLRSLGHEVYCFAPRVPGYDEPDAPVYRMPSLPLPYSSSYRLTVPVVGRRQRHDVLERLDVLHAHSPFVTGWMSVRYSRRLRIPLVYTYHTRLEEYAHYVPFDPAATRRAASTLTRNFANLTDAVVVPTPPMRDRLVELGVTTHVEVIPSGIDLAHFSSGARSETLRTQLGARDGDRLLLFVSRLAREKNVDLLLDALATSPAWAKLAIAGDGPERAALEERARELGLTGRIAFLGAVEREALPELYASADAFVFPSVTETQGLVLAEAMAAGAFIIAAATEQAADVLGGCGRLVDATADAFAQAIAALPPAPSAAEAAKARAAAERYGIEEQSRRICALYETLLTRTYVRSMMNT